MAIFARFSDDNSNVIGTLVANDKVFSSGSVGFYTGDKLTIGGKRYQVSVQLVEIGSKGKYDPETGLAVPQAETAPTPKAQAQADAAAMELSLATKSHK